MIERDIRDVARLREGSDLLKMMELLAERTGTLLNVSELSTALKKARITIENHLAIMEKCFSCANFPPGTKTPPNAR